MYTPICNNALTVINCGICINTVLLWAHGTLVIYFQRVSRDKAIRFIYIFYFIAKHKNHVFTFKLSKVKIIYINEE